MTYKELISMRGQTSVGLKTSEELAQEYVDKFNDKVGYLKGYDCPICKNKGQIAVLQEGEDRYKACTCMELRRSHKSQLEILMDICRLDNYETNDEWQARVKRSAESFLKEGDWYYIGGSTGAGKTHICTAILRELAKEKKCVYMLWRDESVKLKAIVNESNYGAEIEKYTFAEVLYIDDFFKGGVTQADINLAYEIINNRYNMKLKTIISSEKLWKSVLEIDEAIGSRIGQRCGKYIINLINQPNWRTHVLHNEGYDANT